MLDYIWPEFVWFTLKVSRLDLYQGVHCLRSLFSSQRVVLKHIPWCRCCRFLYSNQSTSLTILAST